MRRLYDSLVEQHDPLLVLLAACVCLFASWAIFKNLARAVLSRGPVRWSWLAAGAITAGCSIWATHFLAMLAYDNGVEVGYDPTLTLVSGLLASAFALTGLGLIAWRPTRDMRLIGGAVVGAGIGSMHYTGVAGMVMPADIGWHMDLVVLSLFLGVAFSAAAMTVAFDDRETKQSPTPETVVSVAEYRNPSPPARRLLAAALLCLAVCTLHFVAMAAVVSTPHAIPATALPAIPVDWMAGGVAATMALILALNLLGVVNDEQRAQGQTAEVQRLLRLVNSTFEGLVVHDGDKVLDVNETLLRILGCEEGDVVGTPVLQWIAPEHHDRVRGTARETSTAALEVDITRIDGGRIPVEIRSRDIEFNGRQLKVVALRDISERREADERIRHLAHHDALTGLPNRSLFQDRLQQALARARRGSEQVALHRLGLDRFKEINDLYGHDVGDRLLCNFAERLREAARETDTVARIGGDEFAVIQGGVDDVLDAAQLAQRSLKLLDRPIVVGGQEILAGASVGISFFPQDGDNADTVLLQAEKALVRAKSEGRGKYRFFEPAMDANLRARRDFEVDLREAIENDGLDLHYQMQVSADDGAVTGFEALARWTSDKHGSVSPGVFIPLAEDTGLIVDLGRWVLRRACRDAMAWPPHMRVGVNLSPLQFKQTDLPKLVAETLAETGLEPERLELEITEGVLIDDDARAFETLTRLKALGVRLAMDDFGTGYSSLSYLQRFPFDKIKVDQSFVRDLHSRPDAKAIVRAVIGLGNDLDLSVIAEGVETEAEFNVLRREGCRELQGFYFGRPIPLAEVEALLRRDDPEGRPRLTLVSS